jgi:uncharacterized protein
MNRIIQQQLTNIENENNVKILYAIESGSRGWGFESKDSDYDVRFLYVHEANWYLNVFEGPDIIEIPVDEVLDINGWDLRKGLQLMYKSNPPLLEWLSSPIVYRQNQTFIEELRAVAQQYFAPVPVIYHYINLAKKSLDGLGDSENIKLKKLFYVIRPIFSCMWVGNYHTIPPMNLQAMMSELKIDKQIRKTIDKLILIKADSTEADTIKQPLELIQFLKGNLDYYDHYIKNVENIRNRDASKLNEFFQKILTDYHGGV